jgi:hypothetical protein
LYLPPSTVQIWNRIDHSKEFCPPNFDVRVLSLCDGCFKQSKGYHKDYKFLLLFGKIQQSHFDSESFFFTLEGGLAASGLLSNNLSIDCNV